MEILNNFGKTANGLAKNPLGFIVLIYGFASLVVGFSENLTVNERLPLIWFLIIFPVIVLFIFTWLVINHHKKLYAPKDYTNDKSFLDTTINNNHAREGIDNINTIIDKKIHDTVTSKEFISKLNKPNKKIGEILNDIASKTSKEIYNSAFIEIDQSAFTNIPQDTFSYPISAFNDFNDLLDEIYFKLETFVEVFAYGYSWVLINAKTNKPIKSARMIIGAKTGKRVHDNRSLSEVGIIAGSKLIVTKVGNSIK